MPSRNRITAEQQGGILASGFYDLTIPPFAKRLPDGPEFPSVALGTTSRILSQSEIMRRFVRAYIQGLYQFRRDKASSMKAVEKYLRLSDRDVLEDTYRQFRDYVAEPPYISKSGLEQVIRLVAEKDTKARGKVPSDFVDERALEDQARNDFLDAAKNQK